MSKKLCIGSSLLIFIILCLIFYYNLTFISGQYAETDRFSTYYKFVFMVGVQLFYACIGFLYAFALRKYYPRIILPRVFAWLGLFLILVFVLGIMIYWNLPESLQKWYYFFRNFWYYWLTYPSLLSICTFLIGLAIPLDKPMYQLQRRSMITSQLVLLMLCMFLYKILFRLVSYTDWALDLNSYIMIRDVFIDPLFYISVGALAMEGIFSYWKNPINLPWLRWLGIALVGLTIFSGIAIVLNMNPDQSTLALYQIPEVFVLPGILLSWGFYSTKKDQGVHMNVQA